MSIAITTSSSTKAVSCVPQRFGRRRSHPTNRSTEMMSIPLIISVLLFVGWLRRRPKRWGTQLTAFVLLLVVMAIDIPLAVNTYSAVWTTYGMTVLIVFILIPLVQFIDSVRRMQRLVQT